MMNLERPHIPNRRFIGGGTVCPVGYTGLVQVAPSLQGQLETFLYGSNFSDH